METKRKISIFLIIAILFTSIFSTSVSALKVGDIIGNVLNTDIKTYINGQRIPSYNINNKSVVLIADLRNYGFDVVYNDAIRTSTVTRNYSKQITPIQNIANNTAQVGTVAFSYLHTDISAVLDGIVLESFNVQGNLAIFFSALKDYGTFEWDNNKRESKLSLYLSSKELQVPQIKKEPQANTINFYKEYPTVPDFGTNTGAKLIDKYVFYDDEDSVAWYYEGYDVDKMIRYTNLLEAAGLKYDFTTDINIYYSKNEVVVAIGRSDNQTRISCWKPQKTSNKQDIKYYAAYPSVPDFGVFSGAKLIKTNFKDTFTGFVYDIYSEEIVKKYCNLLIENGFVYDLDFDFYIKDDYAIQADIGNYGTSIFIGFFSAIELPTDTNSESSASSEYTFPLHIYSNDGKTYLGKCITDKYDSDSIYNQYGKYGSKYQTNSIFNEYGTYGSKYQNTSAFNERANKPPKIVDNNGRFVAYLTTNPNIEYGIDFIILERFLIDNGQ